MYSERQKEIMQVALELISEKGIQGLTIKNLSSKIGVSEPALYRHFENKNQILISILENLKKNSSQFFQLEKISSDHSLVKIEKLFLNHFNAFQKTPALTSIVFSEELFRNEPELLFKMKDVIFHNKSILSEIIQSGQIKNEIRNDIDAETLAIIIMGSLRLYIKEWQMKDFEFNIITDGINLIEKLKLLLKK